MIRLGARDEDEEVIIAPDFSTAAYMLEEYLALATTRIAISKSSPEAKSILQFPKLLQKRIVLINDDQEREAVSRILCPVLIELGIKERDSGLGLAYPSGMPCEVRRNFDILRKSLLRLAIGFNHGLQVGVYPSEVRSLSRNLRGGLANDEGRIVLAQLEGLLAVYGEVEFDAPLPPESSPPELISFFDRLLNDPSYLELSSSVADLGAPEKRQAALSRIRDWGRKLLMNSLLTKGGNYGGKAIKAWTGAPVPEADAMLSMFTGKTFPLLVDLRESRKRAIARWQQSLANTQPLSAFGESYTGVSWIVTGAPPENWDGGELMFHTFGTVRTLKTSLEKHAQQNSGGDG